MSAKLKAHRLVDLSSLKAAAKDGALPTEIMLMLPGNWRTVKGDFTLTPDDFQEAVVNFERGVARVGGTAGLPINFNHEQSGPAAAWMNGLENRGAEGLWATGIEWSTLGTEQVMGGVYKFFSIEYWFSYYEEPDQAGVYYNNVVEGGAMTNIPLMRGLTPVMADKSTSGLTNVESTNTIYLEQGAIPVDLTKLRAKKSADLTTEERKFLADRKDQLTDAERQEFGFVAAPKTAEQIAADKIAADKAEADRIEAAKLDADKVVMTKAEAEQLKADAAAGRDANNRLNEKEVAELLATHVKRGAIKPSAVAAWSKTLTAASKELRADLETQLKELPDNKIVANEIGKDEKGDLGTEAAQAELHTKVVAAIKVAADKGESLAYSAARKQVLTADSALADRIKTEQQ